MTGLPDKVDPRDTRLQVLKEKLELGLMGLAFNFWLIEEWKRTCVLVVVFPFSTHRDIFNVNNYLFLPEQLRPLKWPFFLFCFFCQWQNLVFGHKVSALQESHQAEHTQIKWKIAVLQYSVISALWMQESLCVYYGHLPTPLHTLFIHLLATTEMQGTCIQKSCHWDDF